MDTTVKACTDFNLYANGGWLNHDTIPAASSESGVVKGALSSARQGSAVAGFMGVRDRSLLEPYAEKYFAAVPAIVATRTHALAQQIVVGLFPALLTTQATIDQTDAFLASLPAESAALRRMMLENRDGVARALRARAADVLPDGSAG